MGYSFWLTARVLLHAPSHRQDSTYHSLCYTSRGALAGMRNSSMGPPHEGSIREWTLLPRSYISLPISIRVLLHAPSHRHDSTYHGLCYTSRGALAGTRNSFNIHVHCFTSMNLRYVASVSFAKCTNLSIKVTDRQPMLSLTVEPALWVLPHPQPAPPGLRVQQVTDLLVVDLQHAECNL